MRRSLTLDLASTVLGRGMAAVLLFVSTPIYIHLIGVESYGLISFYATVLASCLFLDQAISPIVARRFAQSRANPAGATRDRDTIHTVERLAVAMGSFLALCLFAGSGWVADHMLQAATLPRDRVVNAIEFMALMLALQWPAFVYGAALAGIGDQTAANLIRAGIATAQWLGGALVLALVSPTIESLFAWHSVCLLAQTLITRRRIMSGLVPGDRPACWDFSIISSGWRFSAGTLVIGITGTILTQADKFLISTSVSLGQFAAYALAGTLTSTIGAFVVQPVMAIAFPHFTHLVSMQGDSVIDDRLRDEYRRWTQVIVAVVVPLVCVMVFYGGTILRLWLGHRGAVVVGDAAYLPWMALGTMFNVLMMLPFNLQLAHGWTSLSARKNIFILPFFLCYLIIEIPRIGPLAGGIAWFAINIGYYLVEVPLMHRRLLRTTLWDWWIVDTLMPCALGLGGFFALKSVAGQFVFVDMPLMQCALFTAIIVVCLVAALPAPRTMVRNALRALKATRKARTST